MKQVISLMLCALLAEHVLADNGAKPDPRRSVVRIIATRQFPILTRPWLKRTSTASLGCGVVISEERILTAAHLVAHAAHIQVQLDNPTRRYPARIAAIAPEVDLAVLKVHDESFFEHRAAIAVSVNLPRIGDNVVFYGYPPGGHSLRPTGGVASRIEYAAFDYGANGLRIELNAAVNQGNSGGPVVKDGAMIGLVFGASLEGANICYAIAGEEIEAFLADVEDGKYDGKDELWVNVQGLENPALRRKMKLGDDITGVLVNRRHRFDPADPLQPGDVITHIGEHEIDSAGMVNLPHTDLRVSFAYLATKLADEGKVELTVIREGQARKLLAPVHAETPLLVPCLKADQPSYFVWGPLAFSAATGELVDGLLPLLADVWMTHRSPLLTRRWDFKKSPDEQLVVVIAAFPHTTGNGYQSPVGQVVSQVNGDAIRNLRDLARRLREANRRQEPFVEFRFADQYADVIVLDREQVMASFDEILANNGIRRAASSDVEPAWQSEKR